MKVYIYIYMTYITIYIYIYMTYITTKFIKCCSVLSEQFETLHRWREIVNSKHSHLSKWAPFTILSA